MLVTPKRLKLPTSNLAFMFPGTVQTWPLKFFLIRGRGRVTCAPKFKCKLLFCKNSVGGESPHFEGALQLPAPYHSRCCRDATNVAKLAVTRCQILQIKCAKFSFDQGSAPYPSRNLDRRATLAQQFWGALPPATLSSLSPFCLFSETETTKLNVQTLDAVWYMLIALNHCIPYHTQGSLTSLPSIFHSPVSILLLCYLFVPSLIFQLPSFCHQGADLHWGRRTRPPSPNSLVAPQIK